MAVERTYQQQVGARAQDVAVQTSPDAYGAQIGAAVGELGQTVHRGEIQQYQIQRQASADAELSEATRKIAEAKAALVPQMADLRANAAPDGKGHVEAAAAAWADRTKDITTGITEDRVRLQVQGQLDNYRGALSEREAVWQAGQSVAHTVGNAEKTQNVMLSEIARDPSTYAEHTQSYHDYVDGLSGIDAVGKLKMKDAYDQAAGVTFLKNSEPVAALGKLATKQFDFLSPEARDQVQRDAETEIWRQMAAAATQAVAQKRDINESTDLVIKQVKDGQVFSDGDLAVLEQQATAADLPPAKIYEIQDARALNRVKTEFSDASPEVIANGLRSIDAEIAKAGAGASTDLVQRRNHMQAVLEQRRSEITNDPLGWAAKNGISVPAVDWAAPDANAVAERAKASDIAAKSSGGQPQYFTQDEVAQFKGQIGSGKQGALAALDAARAFGGARAVVAAKQLAPNDPGFAYLASIDREVAGMALSGRWHLKTDRQAVTLDKNSDHYDDFKAEFDQQDARTNKAIQSLGAQQANTVWNTAREILAGYIAQGEGPLRPDLRWRAINEALGATGPNGAGRKGGLAMWGDTYFKRPDTMTTGDFTQRVQWTMAHGPGGGPKNPDGSNARISAAVPVMVGTNTYRFDAKDGKPLRKADGSLFTVWTGK